VKLVFVSGPLGTEDRWPETVREACRLANVVADLGFAVYLPHAHVEWHRHFPADYETWIERDFDALRCCDVLVRLPGVSPGADREWEVAAEVKTVGSFGTLSIPRIQLACGWDGYEVAKFFMKEGVLP